MEQETMNITYPAKDVESIIRAYFGDSLRELNVYMIGRFASVTITYEDFKSKRKIRRELEDKIPNIEIDQLERIYSEKTMFDIFNEMCEEDIDIYVQEPNGSLRKTKFILLIEEILYHRNFN